MSYLELFLYVQKPQNHADSSFPLGQSQDQISPREGYAHSQNCWSIELIQSSPPHFDAQSSPPREVCTKEPAQPSHRGNIRQCEGCSGSFVERLHLSEKNALKPAIHIKIPWSSAFSSPAKPSRHPYCINNSVIHPRTTLRQPLTVQITSSTKIAAAIIDLQFVPPQLFRVVIQATMQ